MSEDEEERAGLTFSRDQDGSLVIHVGGGGSPGRRYQARTGVPVAPADLPIYDISQMILDGMHIDLSESRVERPGVSHVSLIVPVHESPIVGVPIRVRIEGVHDVDLSDDTGIDIEPATVMSLTHHGDGRFTIAYIEGVLTFTAQSLTVSVEHLSLRRPPYVRVEPEEGSDGLLDVATTLADIPCSIDLDGIDLPPELKARLRRSGEIYLEGHYGPEFYAEQEAIRVAVAAALPDTVVS